MDGVRELFVNQLFTFGGVLYAAPVLLALYGLYVRRVFRRRY